MKSNTRPRSRSQRSAISVLTFLFTAILAGRYQSVHGQRYWQEQRQGQGQDHAPMHAPLYDHGRRDYYLIKIQTPNPSQEHQHHRHRHHDRGSPSWFEDQPPTWTLHEDQQQLMGDVLGLKFESKVGMLPNYFIYSAPKPVALDGTLTRISRKSSTTSRQSHTKRSFMTLEDGETEGEANEADNAEREEKGDEEFVSDSQMDPVVERFYQLKGQYSGVDEQSNSSNRKQKRHDTMQAEIVKIMDDIQKQELRQRVKKRAPVPNPDPRPLTPKEGGDIEEEDDQEEEQGEDGNDEGGSGEETEQQQQEDEGEDEKEDGEEEQVSEQENLEEEEGQDEENNEEPGEDEDLPTGEGKNKDKEEEEDKEYQPKGEDQPEDDLAGALGFEDPGFRFQWHLHNTKDRHDINVTGVWEQGINGTGVNVAIIDDGLDMESEDLAPNFFKEGSWDFNDNNPLPKPRLIDDQHGTRCAGEIAAAKNDLCGVGVAYGAKVAGLRILSGQITDADEAAALNYNFQNNHVYSCSWGPPDDGRSMDAPKGVVLDAMINGIKKGRGGLGSIYVFATGNGGSQDDDCNFDGYTNSLYTVSIGAIDRHQRHPYYSEACSAQLAVTYSNGGGSAIYTCDVGERRCFGQHGGTSAAAPIAAGMIALVLSVRPDLSWRDIQYLLMITAIPVSTSDSDWKRTAAGRLFNHKFGYGSLDAYQLVETAKTFVALGPQTSFHPPAIQVKKAIPQGGKGISSILTVTEKDLQRGGQAMGDVGLGGLGKLEHITVTVNIQHQRRGDVEVLLVSPNKVESKLGARRRFDTATTGFVNWTFMTVKHWDEDPVGEWTLTVRDQSNPALTGKFIDWRIKFWGEEAVEMELEPVKNPMPSKEQDYENENEEEQVLNEEETQVDLPATLEDNEKNSDKDKDTNTDGKVIVDVHNKELDKEKQTSSSTKEHQPGLGSIITTMEEDAATDAAMDAKAALAVEIETEEQVARTVGHTLYIFCGVLGLAGLIIGYMTKHKWDGGRGRYMGLRGNPSSEMVGGGGRGRGFGNDDDDIDLLPRGGSSSSVSSGSNDRYNDSKHEDDDGEDEENRLVRGSSSRGGRREEMKSRPYDQHHPHTQTPSQVVNYDGPDRFEIGSDTDEDDFLVASNEFSSNSKSKGKGKGKARATNSPATLKVERF